MICEDHIHAAANKKWSHSGLTKHMRDCNGPIDGLNILEAVSGKNKRGEKYDLRIKEALYIRHYNTGPWRGIRTIYSINAISKRKKFAQIFPALTQKVEVLIEYDACKILCHCEAWSLLKWALL